VYRSNTRTFDVFGPVRGENGFQLASCGTAAGRTIPPPPHIPRTNSSAPIPVHLHTTDLPIIHGTICTEPRSTSVLIKLISKLTARAPFVRDTSDGGRRSFAADGQKSNDYIIITPTPAIGSKCLVIINTPVDFVSMQRNQ